jgi:hypothetical protein
MRPKAPDDEWRIIQSLLPESWEAAAKEQKAFQRARYMQDAGSLLRLLLFHAVNDCGLRETVAQAQMSGIASMSQVALFKRLKTSGAWLAWIGAGLARSFREEPRVPHSMRIRAIDSTTVQGPASKGTDWRVHYSLDLVTLNCDWYELTDQHSGELLERTPMSKGDLIIADRNYLRIEGVKAARAAGAHVLVRVRWRHNAMLDSSGEPFHALAHAKGLSVGQIGQWPVRLVVKDNKEIKGRVIIVKIPGPLAKKAERRALRNSSRERKVLDPRSIEATHYVILFTTLPESRLNAKDALELYRCRWQIELAFKRHKQLLKIGRLPHKEPKAAQSWIQAKLVMALLLERLYRNASSISPWGYSLGEVNPIIISP